jgi:hypothetical protein
MPRWKKNNLSPQHDVAAIRESFRPDIEAPRDVEEDSRLLDLLRFSQVLLAWVAQFDVNSPATLLAAGAVGHHGIARFMEFISGELAKLAPRRVSSHRTMLMGTEDRSTAAADSDGGVGTSMTAWLKAKQELSEALNSFDFLREQVAGYIRMEPDTGYPYDELPDRVTWTESWEPGDEEVDILTDTRYPQISLHTFLRRDWDKAQRLHNQIARAARHEIEAFVAGMTGDMLDVGFPRIGELVAALPKGGKKSRLKRTLKRCEQLTRAILDLFATPLPNDPTPYGRPHEEFFVSQLVDRFIDAGRKYAEECLPLTGKPRGSLQAKRKKILRRFAIVAQYAFLVSGNGLFRRFATVVATVDVFAQHLQACVKQLLDAESAKYQVEESELRGFVHDLNLLIIEPKVLERWRTGLKKAATRRDADYYGRFIVQIVKSVKWQAAGWDRGDAAQALTRVGLITAKGKDGRGQLDAIRDACFVMQQVGLAVQAPFHRMLDDPKSFSGDGERELNRKVGENTPWVVNPLGAVLAAERRPRGAGRGAGGRTGSQRRQKGSHKKVVRRAAAKVVREASPTPKKKRAPRARVRATAAKKKPRA